MLATLEVSVRPGRFGVVSLPSEERVPSLGGGVEALVVEDEGTTVIATETLIGENAWPVSFIGSWLTLAVHSSLEAVGLTAAFAKALGEFQIPCNVVAGYFHDHILVPHAKTDLALACLAELRDRHTGTTRSVQGLTAVSRDEVAADSTLQDWRFLLGRIEARFETGSFSKAAAFVSAVAALSDQADHHPDLDVRYPGTVHLALVTHATAGLTVRDSALARSISEHARLRGYTASTSDLERHEIVIDALDPEAVLPFWQAALGYRRSGSGHELVDPKRVGPVVLFQQMHEPRPQRNRIHLDVSVPHDVADARVAAALAAGGTLVSATRARAFWTLADVEGNEVCICTWQDR